MKVRKEKKKLTKIESKKLIFCKKYEPKRIQSLSINLSSGHIDNLLVDFLEKTVNLADICS